MPTSLRQHWGFLYVMYVLGPHMSCVWVPYMSCVLGPAYHMCPVTYIMCPLSPLCHVYPGPLYVMCLQ